MAVNLIVGTNSYISVADATAYFAERLWSTAWFEATAEQQAQALIMATKVLDRQLYKGKLKDSSQVLKFPRCYKRYPLAGEWDYVGNLAESIYDRDWYCEVSVHKNVKKACCEEALAMLERGNSQRLKLRQEGVTSITIGSLRESYGVMPGKGFLSLEAKELLKSYLAGAVLVT
jgi:hypothetical protein